MNRIMPERIKAIRKLLVEERWIKAELAGLTTLWGAKHEDYAAVRTELFAEMHKIKLQLAGYSAHEIHLARTWERLIEDTRTAGCRSGGRLEADEPESKPESDEDVLLKVLLFFYLLARNRPIKAFLSLSIGWPALLFDFDEVPKNSDELYTEQRMKPRLKI